MYPSLVAWYDYDECRYQLNLQTEDISVSRLGKDMEFSNEILNRLWIEEYCAEPAPVRLIQLPAVDVLIGTNRLSDAGTDEVIFYYYGKGIRWKHKASNNRTTAADIYASLPSAAEIDDQLLHVLTRVIRQGWNPETDRVHWSEIQKQIEKQVGHLQFSSIKRACGRLFGVDDKGLIRPSDVFRRVKKYTDFLSWIDTFQS